MMRKFLLVALLAATPATADVPEVVTDHILPGVARFAQAAETLSITAARDCTADSVIPAYHAAFDAWLGISHLTFGPLETDGRGLTIAFWPDTRGIVGRTVAGLIAAQDPVVENPQAFQEVSIAGRGLFALERVLFGESYGPDHYACRLVQAQAGDLGRMAQAIDADWADYAQVMLSAGDPGNNIYLSAGEAGQALYTALMTGLEFNKDQRIGRPLGTFERPRPRRAEAYRSGRSLRNVALSLVALQDMVQALSDTATPATDDAFQTAFDQIESLDDPVFAGVSDPVGRLKVEILGQKIAFVQDAVTTEVGVPMGLSQGFNSADGD